MKKAFISDNFLLYNQEAEHLYHTYAANQPIIDYHCHLPPDEINEDRVFKNLTEVWIDGDHYKWRAMRAFGIQEDYITGTASPEEKFKAWAKTVPQTLRNPLYHWTHLELKRYFDMDELLNAESATDIYTHTKALLGSPEYSCRNLLKRMNVEVVCTTDDPIDDLSHHQGLKDFEIKIRPAFRPDHATTINAPNFGNYIIQLGQVADINIESFQNLCDALRQRIDYFHENGCRLSDHGLSYIPNVSCTQLEAERIFKRALQGETIHDEDAGRFQIAVLQFVCQQYHQLGWVQQFHLGALRNTNQRMYKAMGPNTGWDTIGGFSQALGLARFLDLLDTNNQLARTIIYNLNPADNELFAAMVGNFNDGTIRGKMQYGSAWWFLDQKDGMTKQINALSNLGLLSCFVGMLTDSRSFLSYPRHEYFRRILCNLLGSEMAKGELPYDYEMVGELVANVCYNNAKNYFDF